MRTLLAVLALCIPCSVLADDRPLPDPLGDEEEGDAEPGQMMGPDGVPTRRLQTGDLLVRPTMRYPEEAKAAGISGRVLLQLLFDERGRVVRRGHKDCPWRTMDAAERKARTFHPSRCVEALTGPRELQLGAVDAWAAARVKPWPDTPAVHFALFETTYKLHGTL